MLLLVAFATSCGGSANDDAVDQPAQQGPSGGAGGTASGVGATGPRYVPTPSEALLYMSVLAKSLVARVLSDEEESVLENEGEAAIAPMLTGWTTEQAFAEFARAMVETRIWTGGEASGKIDYNLPGRIVTHVVRHNLPWAEVLTSPRCYDADDQAMPCDTGAPFSAGLLTTRAFLESNADAYNMGRAQVWFSAFACRQYPFEEELEPLVDASRLVSELAATELSPLPDGSADGSGRSCYSCHGQAAPHAQLFVKFDDKGRWDAAATGLQAEGASLGRSERGFFASHYVDSEQAQSERSVLFGVGVDHLGAAAEVLTAHPVFERCTVQLLLDQAIGLERDFSSLDQSQSLVAPELLEEIAAKSRADTPPLTLASLAVHTFSHPRVEEAVVRSVMPE